MPKSAFVLKREAGLGTRMRPYNGHLPKPLVTVRGKSLIDYGLDRLADAGIEQAVVNVHHLADALEQHLARRQRPRIIISDERAELLGTGGGIAKALPKLGTAPFFLINADTFWLDGVKSNFSRLAEAYDAQTMDALLLLAPTAGSIGYDGRGDYAMLSDGQLRRRGEHEVVPYIYAGAAILSPALFAGAPNGAFALTRLFDQAAAKGRLFGLRLEGVWMHVGTPQAVADAEAALAATELKSGNRYPPLQIARGESPSFAGITESNGTNPRVFTIPASAPFLPTLIGALFDGKLALPALRDPLAMASATLYLPTRRACRLARDTFLDVLKDDAAILPRIVAIGDIDEDEIAFAEAATGELATEALALPEALDGLERRLLLARLIVNWANSPALHGQSGTPLVAQTPAAACVLADDLARLIDDMTTRGVPWKRLDELVPDNFDEYWQQTLEVFEIARDRLAGDARRTQPRIEAAERRDKLIKAEAARLARKTDGLVIAAGSTGSIPATAELIATIANLPHGAVVLPGLDTDLDEESWRLIAGDKKQKIAAAPGHPQFAMQALLTRIGIARQAVGTLAKANGRETLLSEAMRPAMQTDIWQKRAGDLVFEAQADAAISTMTVIEAANAEEEALAIAVALREAVQDGKTAALITPDRVLGRRVAAALMRWNIAVEDTGGDPLAETSAGIFARLAAQAALTGLEPVTLLALLKHPLLRLGANDQRYATDILERAVLRGPRPSRGTAGLASALKSLRAVKDKLHWSDPRRDLSDGQIAEAESLVAKLAAALQPLEKSEKDSLTLNTLAARHRAVLAALSEHNGEQASFIGPDGAKLGAALDELATSPSAASLQVGASDYVELFTAALSGRVVRRPLRQGLRVRILGLLEARLTDSDRVVLGGLVEGTWPPDSRSDAWLSRPMRLDLGLDLPERRIGLTAHDFAQLLGAREVIMTLSAKIGGAPTVPSRFIQRLAAVSGERWQGASKRGEKYLVLGAELDHPENGHTGAAAGAQAAACSTAKRAFRHRDRTLAARPLHDLRQAHSAFAAARSGRLRARCCGARHVHSQRDRRIRADLQQEPACRPCRRTACTRAQAFCRDRRLSGGTRILVASLRAHRALVRQLGDRAARRHCDDRCGDQRRTRHQSGKGHFPAARHCRPYRTQQRRPLHDLRLQDRFGAFGAAGAHRSRAAAHA